MTIGYLPLFCSYEIPRSKIIVQKKVKKQINQNQVKQKERIVKKIIVKRIVKKIIVQRIVKKKRVVQKE